LAPTLTPPLLLVVISRLIDGGQFTTLSTTDSVLVLA
jgi:hypothetical protein